MMPTADLTDPSGRRFAWLADHSVPRLQEALPWHRKDEQAQQAKAA
jgi:hypothetical protein